MPLRESDALFLFCSLVFSLVLSKRFLPFLVFVCAWVLGEARRGRFLIREQMVSRKWLFGTDCSAEGDFVYAALEVRVLRSPVNL